MKYPHWIRISKPGSGPSTQDPRGGVYTPAAGEVIYSGEADVQDVGESVVRGADVQTEESEATIFLADESVIPLLETGHTIEIWWTNPAPVGVAGSDPLPDGVEAEDDAVVTKVVRLDGTLGARFV